MSAIPDTYFAPAARLPREEIEREAALFKDPLLDKLVNAVTNVVLILNKQRQIVYVNDNLLNMMGASDSSALLGRRPGEVFSCEHALTAPNGCGTCESCRFCGAVKTILASLEGRVAEDECRITQMLGDEIAALDLRVKGTPITIEGQNYSIFAIQDISHEKRRRSLERIFFHDLLNIAGGLRTLVDLLHEQAPKYLKDDVAMIGRYFNALLDEIHSHRMLLAAENNDLDVCPQLVEAKSLLRSAMKMYSGHEAAKNRTLVLDPVSENFELNTDVTLLRRVLGNLIKNALEASKAGGSVTLGCAPALRSLKVEAPPVEAGIFWVHNETSMSEESKSQMFKRSYSTKGAGRGLGAYSVRLLTERYLRGKVSFTSKEEAGTTFWVALPLALPPTDGAPGA
jgi:signal transduction histidine kinase